MGYRQFTTCGYLLKRAVVWLVDAVESDYTHIKLWSSTLVSM